MVTSRKKLDFWFWVKLLVIGFMLVFLIYPFCTLITRSFFSAKTEQFSLENYIRFFTKKYYYSALGRSLFVSCVTTCTALLVGVPMAYVMSRYNVFGKNFIHIFIIMSLMSPPFIGAYSWIMLFGRAGLVTKAFATIGIHLPRIYGKLRKQQVTSSVDHHTSGCGSIHRGRRYHGIYDQPGRFRYPDADR